MSTFNVIQVHIFTQSFQRQYKLLDFLKDKSFLQFFLRFKKQIHFNRSYQNKNLLPKLFALGKAKKEKKNFCNFPLTFRALFDAKMEGLFFYKKKPKICYYKHYYHHYVVTQQGFSYFREWWTIGKKNS